MLGTSLAFFGSPAFKTLIVNLVPIIIIIIIIILSESLDVTPESILIYFDWLWLLKGTILCWCAGIISSFVLSVNYNS